MATVETFRPQLDAGALQALRQRLAMARLPRTGMESWDGGVPRQWLADLLADWQGFDIEGFQAQLDAQQHVYIKVRDLAIHAVHEIGQGPSPRPLLLTHGWPGSFCEFHKLIPLLTDPESHGGSADEAFTVVTLSLPGFGFSGPPPPEGLPPSAVAEIWNEVMVDAFGYKRYFAHGSDLGAGVTAHLARLYPGNVAGIHLATPGLAPPPEPLSEPEKKFAAEVKQWVADEGGYAHEHATKPFTIGAALHDSPVGLAAWIGEKVRAWSDVGPAGEPTFDRDLLLATLTLYWATGTVASSLLPYWAYRNAPGDQLPLDDPPGTPTAVSIFGGEQVPFPKPPRELVERYFSLSSWEQHGVGGHFPAVSEPRLLAEALRNAFRPLRS